MSRQQAATNPARARLRLASRHALITAALLVQFVVLGIGWFVTFRVVQHEFAQLIQERVKGENRELARRIETLFPSGVISEDSAAAGVEFGGDTWDRLQRIIESEAFSMLPAGGFACLIEADGRLLCHPEIRDNPDLRRYTFEGIELREGIDAAFGEDIGELAASRREAAGVAEFSLGDVHYVATRPLADTGLQLLIHQPVGGILRISRANNASIAAVAGLMALLVLSVTGGGLAFLLRRYDSVQEALNRQLKENLRTAKRIQESTLPARWPDLSGYDVAAWSRPAEETGGDTFDVIGLCHHEDGRATVADTAAADSLAMVLADASGHGVGPAIAVTQLQAAARVAWRSRPDLMDVTRLISDRLAESLPDGRFITAWLGRLDAGRDEIEFYAAGHGPFFRVAADGRVETFAADSYPFGIDGRLASEEPRRVTLASGDLFVVVSDGILEARDAAGTQFGADRLTELLLARRGDDADRIADAIRRAVDEHASDRRDDDQTVLVIKRLVACRL